MRQIAFTLVVFFGFPLFAATQVQTSACFPATAEAKNWPISVIYMHGLFEPGGEGSTEFRGLERANRARLEKMAREKHIRIAVPLAPAHGKWRSWNGLSVEKIEQMAQAACGGAPLEAGRDLIGFSNGAICSQKFTCGNTMDYAHVFSIGAAPYQTSGGHKKCAGDEDRFQDSTPHDFAKGLAKFEAKIADRAHRSRTDGGTAAKTKHVTD